MMALPVVWYYLGTINKDGVKTASFNCGLKLSQKYKKYPAWDDYVEPMLIRQFAIIIYAGHAFIEGMISDNEDKRTVNKALNELNEVECSIIKDRE